MLEKRGKRKKDKMTLVLSVDPGKTSGIAFLELRPGEEPALIWSGEYQIEDYALAVRDAISFAQRNGRPIQVVCERFVINAQTVKNSQAPYSLEMIGILKQVMLDNKISHETIIFQSPSDAKAMFDNAKLKKLGYWYKGGGGHALDAIRHGLLRCMKVGWKPIRLLQ